MSNHLASDSGDMGDFMLAELEPPAGRRRVKVYELRSTDWYDRGTGFCSGQVIEGKALITVESEDSDAEPLLTTDIATAQDGFQKQQDTLIVWTESNGLDLALSFQEPEGCAAIWMFITQVGQSGVTHAQADDSSADFSRISLALGFSLPEPQMANLHKIDHIIRVTSMTSPNRDMLVRAILQQNYIAQLCRVFESAEDFESLPDLHLLCDIIKAIVLLNDSDIIDAIVSDEQINGVVGMLEYDRDFPEHKANHRAYLSDTTKFKEVIPIEDADIKRKIHATYRLQYLKDVVLARILDDPTFSVLNSLIFFNQLEVIQRLQQSPTYFKDLFRLFSRCDVDDSRKKNAILLISQCCTYAKNLQPATRIELWAVLASVGLCHVIVYALSSADPSVRSAGTDIFVSMIDHDTTMVRQFISNQILNNETSLTDLIIDMLLKESSHGVKVQLADALKVLLDNSPSPVLESKLMTANGNRVTRQLESNDPEVGAFLAQFYEQGGSVHRLFRPLSDLKARSSLANLSTNEVSTFCVLIELISIFMRQHTYRSKYFIATEGIPVRIAQLLAGPDKQLQLYALKFFRRVIEHGDDMFTTQIQDNELLTPIFDIVLQTMPRNNLLNSAALEFFHHLVDKPTTKRKLLLIESLVTKHRFQMGLIRYVPLFEHCINIYDRRSEIEFDSEMAEHGGHPNGAGNMVSRVGINGGGLRSIGRWMGLSTDLEEEEYFESSDGEEDEDAEFLDDEDTAAERRAYIRLRTINDGDTPMQRMSSQNLAAEQSGSDQTSGRRHGGSLVDYPDEDEDEIGDLHTPPTASSPSPSAATRAAISELEAELNALRPKLLTPSSSSKPQTPPSKIPLKTNARSTSSDNAVAATAQPRRPTLTSSNSGRSAQPPERLSEKRRREESEEDDLSKHLGRVTKRRSSSGAGGNVEALKLKKITPLQIQNISNQPKPNPSVRKVGDNRLTAASQLHKVRRKWNLNANSQQHNGKNNSSGEDTDMSDVHNVDQQAPSDSEEESKDRSTGPDDSSAGDQVSSAKSASSESSERQGEPKKLFGETPPRHLVSIGDGNAAHERSPDCSTPPMKSGEAVRNPGST